MANLTLFKPSAYGRESIMAITGGDSNSTGRGLTKDMAISALFGIERQVLSYANDVLGMELTEGDVTELLRSNQQITMAAFKFAGEVIRELEMGK